MDMGSEKIKELDTKYVAQIFPHPKPVVALEGKGCILKTADGREYLDLMSGVAVASTGHSHPKVVEAICDQARQVIHANCFGNYAYGVQAELCQMIVERAPKGGRLETVFLCNSGAEAIEGAIKLAVKATGRKRLIYFNRAFHGRTYMTLSVSSKRLYKDPFEPLYPWAIEVPFNDIETTRGVMNDDVAAILVEPIQGEGGIRPCRDDFLPALRDLAHEFGALLIVDEVQTGFGRTGQWFASEHYGVAGDVMTVAKGIASGMPLGGFISSRELMDTFRDPPMAHCSTFGGNPVCCAAAVATIKVIEEENLLENARERGGELVRGMEELRRKYPDLIKEIRGRGLLTAMELIRDDDTGAFVTKVKELGATVGWTMNAGATIRVAPPLVITKEQVAQALDIFDRAFANLKR
ncbi:MAG: aminotransferase class III-fold pyridoxal phosphate-dependent enzyme [Deltaproteobacteria bacterium]|nr:aminotransferase class III-fold pyridoxal phosphate-dependent enzyme [Deltaproteobacteria bacterium]